MTDGAENRVALAEKVDADLLQFLARLPRRQQRAVLLLLMVVENLLYESSPPGLKGTRKTTGA